MKEVKFRAWDKVNNRMADVERLVWQNGKMNSFADFCAIRYPDGNGANGYAGSDFVLQQYTGRKDSTGAELYDGDIIVFKFRTKTAVFEYIGKIIFDQYMWLVETEDGEVFSLNRVHGIQLVGNIFENPNLLQ